MPAESLVWLSHQPCSCCPVTLYGADSLPLLLPQVDVHELDREIVLKADTPGMTGADVKVRL